jgi:hypothetical protein
LQFELEGNRKEFAEEAASYTATFKCSDATVNSASEWLASLEEAR